MKTALIIISVLFGSVLNASAVQSTTVVECSVYPAGNGEIKVSLPASFSRSRSPSDTLAVPVSADYSVILSVIGGDGGESGKVTFSVIYKGQMIHKTLWQAGDTLSLAGQKTGLNYVGESKTEPGGADLQYICVSK